MIKKMNISRHLNLKEYVWNTLNKLTNSFSNLSVNNIGNGYKSNICVTKPLNNTYFSTGGHNDAKIPKQI